MEKKNGIVTFIDILGYQNLIDNNDLDKVSEIIEKILDIGPQVNTEVEKIFNTVLQTATKVLKPFDPKTLYFETTVISDSILITKSLNNEDEVQQILSIIAFIYGMMVLNRIALDNGISIKGAIEFGDYILNDKIFASKEILKAYRETLQMDFSGIVLSENFINNIRNISAKDTAKKIIINTLNTFLGVSVCPLKNGLEKEYVLINWITGFETVIGNDLKQYLYKSFGLHNKTITRDVVVKIENTERIARVMQLKQKEPI